MDEKINFSILLTIYDGLSDIFLDECLGSLVIQTLLPNQVVIVRDGIISKSLVVVVSKYKNLLPITEVGYETRMGLGYALNYGLGYCDWNNVLRLDADDICLPMRCELQMNYVVKNPDYCVFGGQAILINNSGFEVGKKYVPTEPVLIRKNIWMNPLIHPSVCLNKVKLFEVGLYNAKLKRRQDYELWFRILKFGYEIDNLSEYLIKHRIANQTCGKKLLKEKFDQAIIGIRGCFQLRIFNPFIYLVIFAPIFFICIPKTSIERIRSLFNNYY
jgi:glycosyltransferase involved in cell wall biosynthesis